MFSNPQASRCIIYRADDDAFIAPRFTRDMAGPEQAKALALAHPKVIATRPGTIGFNANFGKFCSLAYLEAEKKAS